MLPRVEVDEEAGGLSGPVFLGDVTNATGNEWLQLRVGETRAIANGSLIGRGRIDGRDAVIGELVHVDGYQGELPVLVAFDDRSTPTVLSVVRWTPTYAESVDDLEEYRRNRVAWRVTRLRGMREQKAAMAALLPSVSADVQRLDEQLEQIAAWLEATARDHDSDRRRRGR